LRVTLFLDDARYMLVASLLILSQDLKDSCSEIDKVSDSGDMVEALSTPSEWLHLLCSCFEAQLFFPGYWYKGTASSAKKEMMRKGEHYQLLWQRRFVFHKHNRSQDLFQLGLEMRMVALKPAGRISVHKSNEVLTLYRTEGLEG
jgi:hypothetical protein